MADYGRTFKLLVIGDSGVGKTSLILRFCEDRFEEGWNTIGVESRSRALDLGGGRSCRLAVFDAPGQDRFRNVVARCFRGAAGVVIVYDVTDRESFNQIDRWQMEVQKYCDRRVQLLLVGNKSDLASGRAVSYENVKEYADVYHLPYLETSAKTSENVEEAFKLLAESVLGAQAGGVSRERHIVPNSWGPLMLDDSDLAFKFILVGDRGVGKASLILRFASNVFNESSADVECRTRVLEVDGKACTLNVWNAAGEDRSSETMASHYREADGVIIVYDVSSSRSFDNIHAWLQEAEENAPASARRLLVGNKADAVSRRAVSAGEGEALAARLGMPFLETSAKSSENVDAAFLSLARLARDETQRKARVAADPDVRESAGASDTAACCSRWWLM